VSTSLRGAFHDAHVTGDQSAVLPTDSQKNTVYAFAKEHGVGAIEDFALLLARHFVTDVPAASAARVAIDEYGWDRVSVDGRPHDHTFVRRGQEVRTAVATVEGDTAHVVSGLRDLVLLKSTGSEFAGFLVDGYTTLAPTSDRVMATALTARWRYATSDRPPHTPERDASPANTAAADASAADTSRAAWDEAHAEIRAVLVSRFATLHSRALQQTLWEMGSAALEARRDVAEIRLSAPNRHHFVVDLTPFGLDNPGEVFHAADRPYG
jgi:urate oxidase